MKKEFKAYIPFMLVSAMGMNMFHREIDPGAGFTPEQLKAQAEENIKTIAKKAATDALPDMLKSNLSTAEAKVMLKAVISEALKEAQITDEVDNVEKTIPAILKEMQAQYNTLAKTFLDMGGATAKTGVMIDFIKKNIEAGTFKQSSYHANVAIKAAALMSTANVQPNVAGGFSPLFGNFIDTEIGHVPKPDNVILSLIDVRFQPGTEKIWYTDRVNEQGDAQFIAEGALKPLISADYKTSTAEVKEVAERWKFTKRLMNHAPSVVSDFLEHAVELMNSKIDDGALSGDGLGNNLAGLVTKAAAFIVPPQLAAFYVDANIFDVVNVMAARIRLSNFKGQITAVLNTVWETKFMGYKDKEGRYLIPEFVSADGKKIGSVDIVFTNKIDDETILIGELRRFHLVWAEYIQYDEGYENDDFSKNLVSRKLEAFIGTYMKGSDAGSILMEDIATVLTAINKPAEV